jgi:2-methylisocitrate lyase-like PEP mutase family enzyme
MVDKVHAAMDARRDSSTVILVRTDSLGSGGSLTEALDRIAAYAEAGGEVIFMPGIPLDQCPRAVDLTKRPILTSAPSIDAARQNRVTILFMGQMGGIALGAIDRAMRELKATGRLEANNHPSLTAADRNRLMGIGSAVERAKKYNALRD